MTNLQLMCHFIDSHPSVLQDHVRDLSVFVSVMDVDERLAPSSCLTLVRPLLNLSIDTQTICCNMTLFPNCTSFYAFRHLVQLQPIEKGTTTFLCHVRVI